MDLYHAGRGGSLDERLETRHPMETPIHQPALASLSCCRHTGNFCWCEILSWPSSRLHKCAKPVAHPKYWRVKGHKHQGQDPWLRRLRREQYPARQRAQEAQDLHPSSTPSSPVLWSSSQGHLPKSGKVPEVGKTRGLTVTPLPSFSSVTAVRAALAGLFLSIRPLPSLCCSPVYTGSYCTSSHQRATYTGCVCKHFPCPPKLS